MNNPPNLVTDRLNGDSMAKGVTRNGGNFPLHLTFTRFCVTGPSGYSDVNLRTGRLRPSLGQSSASRCSVELMAGMVRSGGIIISDHLVDINNMVPPNNRKVAAGAECVHRNLWATGSRTPDLAAPCVFNNSNQNLKRR